RSVGEILRQIDGERVEPLRRIDPRLPRDLQTIIAKAMKPDPRHRYSTPDELGDDLERLLNLQPIHAKPAGPIARAATVLRRNRKAMAGAVVGSAAAMIIAVLLGMYLLWLPGSVDREVAAARLGLLNPRLTELLFADLLKRDTSEGREPRLAEAISEYEE